VPGLIFLGAYARPCEDEEAIMGRNGEHGLSVSSFGSEPVVRERQGVTACSAASIGVNTLSQIRHRRIPRTTTKTFPTVSICILFIKRRPPRWICSGRGTPVPG
jgi:hypothetical protein